MTSDSQLSVPPAFVALYSTRAGRLTLPRDDLLARHELCEDLATLLTEQAKLRQWELGVTEQDVLARMHQGLLGGEASPVTPAEATWVVRRLAELLDWPQPELPEPGPT
jgi:hypothetical protein